MDQAQEIIEAPIETVKQLITNMTPPADTDTSFAAHVTNQFTSYEKDRQTASKEAIYTTR
jgi:hypothetical protein